MKASTSFVAICLLVAGELLQLFPQSVAVRAMPAQGSGNIYCASDDGHRNYCQADVRGGVQLYKQRSEAACVFAQTWGYERRGIWVDRGCRAEFAIGYTGGQGNWVGWGESYNVYCASDDGRRNRCPVDTRGGVKLARQRSGSPCVYGSTWGYDQRWLWVDRGCRADFEIGEAGWQPPPAQTIYCASDDGNRNYCQAETRVPPRIIRQRSEADCIYGRTWGFDRRGVWVDHGCRADFEVGLDR